MVFPDHPAGGDFSPFAAGSRFSARRRRRGSWRRGACAVGRPVDRRRSYLFHSYKLPRLPAMKLSWEMLQPDRNKPTELVPAKVKEELDGKRVSFAATSIRRRRSSASAGSRSCRPKGTASSARRKSGRRKWSTCNVRRHDHRLPQPHGRRRRPIAVQPKEGDLAGAVYGLEADVFRD